MQDKPVSERKPLSIRVKLLLILGGVVVAYLLVTLILVLFPGLVPEDKPYERQYKGVVVDMTFKVTDGDMFAWFPGRIRPPEDDFVMVAYRLAWDTDGFREPVREADHYPIAAFGDSFTEAANVSMPWPDRLAEYLDVPVYNYGYRDYGPLEIAQAAEEFAAKEPRTWVLYAYFSGNDLVNSNRSELIEERSPFFLMPQLAARVAGDVIPDTPVPTAEHYDYPWPVIIGGSYYEMVFFPNYLWAQLAPADGFEASHTFQITADQLDVIAQSAPDGACLGLIFTPTKEHLYYPFIYDKQWILGLGRMPYIDNKGLLQYEDHPFSSDEGDYVLAHLNDQHDAIAKMVESKPEWHFIDLLPAFGAAVGQEQLLYYPYDSHWNQAGHDLAAQVIADYLQSVPDCPVQ